MQHKHFIIMTIIIACFYFPVMIMYLYVGISLNVRMAAHILKVFPVFLLIIQTIFYIVTYHRHRYAKFLAFGLLACLTGDFLLELNFIGSVLSQITFLGAVLSFTVARLYFSFMFLLSPYRRPLEKMQFTRKQKLVFLLGLIPTAAFTIYYGIELFKNTSLSSAIPMVILLPVYTLVTIIMCICSFFRLSTFPWESLLSKIVSIVGSILFSISDLLLGFILFVQRFPGDELYILSTYWIGVWLLAFSVVRNWESEAFEKEGVHIEYIDEVGDVEPSEKLIGGEAIN